MCSAGVTTYSFVSALSLAINTRSRHIFLQPKENASGAGGGVKKNGVPSQCIDLPFENKVVRSDPDIFKCRCPSGLEDEFKNSLRLVSKKPMQLLKPYILQVFSSIHTAAYV